MPTTPAIKPLVRLAAIYRTLDLSGDPFALDPLAGDVAPLTAFCAGRDTILDWLRELRTSPSLALITGIAGSGRTRLLSEIVTNLSDTAISPLPVTLNDDKLTDIRLLRAIIESMGSTPLGRTGLELVHETRALIATSIQEGRLPVLMLDDAGLAGSQLEIIRSLLTPPDDAPDGYDLRIIMTGDRELRDRLIRRRALADQIACSVDLAPLNLDEVRILVRFRIDCMRTGNGEKSANALSPQFSDDALVILSDWSGGNPGAIIRLAGECLLEAIARGRRDVDGEIAHDVARELTDHARQVARAEAAAPYMLPAVQTKLAFTMTDERENAAHVSGTPGQANVP
ncbi:MAG: AAA family ATPase [Thermomicrobiales bacterium]